MPISKHALIYTNRILSFSQDLEMIDIICTAKKTTICCMKKVVYSNTISRRSTKFYKNEALMIIVAKLLSSIYEKRYMLHL